jgi:adenine/guanine phosphoribosyltransferase-like PRPP-binding protein
LSDPALRDDLAARLDAARGPEGVWGVLRDGKLFARAVDELAVPFRGMRDLVVVAGPRDTALLLGAAIAMRLQAGFAAVRGAGARLGGPKLRRVAGPDVTGLSEVLVLQVGTVSASDRILLVEDWREADHGLEASAGLVEGAGAEVAGVALLVDGLNGGNGGPPVHALVHAEELA